MVKGIVCSAQIQPNDPHCRDTIHSRRIAELVNTENGGQLDVHGVCDPLFYIYGFPPQEEVDL